jgi:hypothetical protein
MNSNSTPNYQALCAEILQKLDQYEDGQRVDWDAWRNNARAALEAQPEPVAPTPTDEEIGEWHDQCADLTRLGEVDHYWAFDLRSDEVAGVVRAALARWGRPAIQPEVIEAVSNCARIELVVALHALASQFENETAVFTGDDLEAVQGHVKHARKIAAKHNRNGPGCAPPVLEAGDGEIDEEAATVIPWLLENAARAADADQSYVAGKLTLAAQLLGERRPANNTRGTH